MSGELNIISRTFSELTTVHMASSAVPGQFYYDETNDQVYKGKTNGKLAALNITEGAGPPTDQTSNGYHDFRFSGLTGVTTEQTTGITLNTNATSGMSFNVSSSSWNNLIKLRAPFDNARSSQLTIDWVFNWQANWIGMFGFCRQSVNVNAITAAYFHQEVGIYIANSNSTTAYGRNRSTNANASETLGGTANYAAGPHYRLRLQPRTAPNNGLLMNLKIEIVDSDNWDTVLSTLIDRTMTIVGGLDPSLCPCIVANRTSTGVFSWLGLRGA